MKSTFLKLLIGLTLFVTTGFDTNDTWTFLKDRTWRSEYFAGSELIFYETANGLKKAIFQVHGSGVPLAGALIFDVEPDKTGAVLRDGLDLMRRSDEVMQASRVDIIGDSVLTFDGKTFKKRFDFLVALNWQSKIGHADSLDIERLKSISIEKKSIYERDSFKK